MSTTRTRAATCLKAYAMQPQLSGNGSRSWITRAANFVVVVSGVAPGAVLARENNPDEYAVLLARTGAAIAAQGCELDAAPESLTFVPPGPSSIAVRDKGQVIRIFSSRCNDLAAHADNADVYAAGASDVAPLVAWPDPPAGLRLRNYRPFEFERSDTMRVFRCTNLMVNVITKRNGPRDPSKLSPHAHDDFEQASLALEGEYIHYLRYPWTTDMAEWRDDEHVQVGNPSVLVIPPRVVHTSRSISSGRSWLIDIFAPPRIDFSNRPGLVLNAEDYPAPPNGITASG